MGASGTNGTAVTVALSQFPTRYGLAYSLLVLWAYKWEVIRMFLVYSVSALERNVTLSPRNESEDIKAVII